IGRAAIEKNLRLEHEAVAHDLNIVPVSKRFFQLAKERRAVLRQLLHAFGERDIETLSKIGDLSLSLLVALIAVAERALQCRHLLAQSSDLLIEKLNLGERLRREPALFVELLGNGGDAGLGRVALQIPRAQKPRKA